MPSYSREQVEIQVRDGRYWQDFAACPGEDMTTFFGPEGERAAARRCREELAKQVCNRCVVVSECLKYALAADEKYGVWGGLGEDERKQLKRQGRAA